MRNPQTIPKFITTFVGQKNICIMNIRSIIIFSFVFFALSANSQTRNRRSRAHTTDTISVLVKSYMDSLQVVRTRIDSVYTADSTYELDGKYSRLFVPLTFYHDVARSAFDLSSNNDVNNIDRTLLDVYLHRPDLVLSTQNQLDYAGTVQRPKQETIDTSIDIIEKVSPKVNDMTETLPINIYVEKPNFWTYSGDYSLQLFQNYVSDNWYKGGESNYSMLATVTLQANYNNKQRFRWDNKLEMRLGFQNTKGDTLHTVRASEDLIRYTGKIGLQASKKWYYTLQLIASTQFMRGLKSNDPHVYSKFLAPLYVNPSLGMDYNIDWFKGKLKGSTHLAPIAYNLTYVRDKSLGGRFGLEPDRHTKSDFGSEITIDLTWQLSKDIRWKTRFYGYTTYKRTLMEWENTFTFVVNKYISSNLFLYPRFDDGAAKDGDHGYWQMKEYISLGFSYGF